MDDLYREVIIERYKTPYYRGHLDPHDIFFEDDNPVCGDHIEITGGIRPGDAVVIRGNERLREGQAVQPSETLPGT